MVCYGYDMKTVLFIPGFREDINSRNYKITLEAIKQKGYSTQFVPINWKNTILNDWVEQLQRIYLKHDPNETILSGFSYGSLTAMVEASINNPFELWLFSLSPYFSDDIPVMKSSWLKEIGKRRVENFSKLNFSRLASKIKCRTLIMFGELEAQKYPLISNRSYIAYKMISNSTLIKVKNADHDVTNSNYIEAIKKSI